MTLEKQGVAPLAGQQGIDAGFTASLGHGDVVEHVPTILTGSRVARGHFERFRSQGRIGTKAANERDA